MGRKLLGYSVLSIFSFCFFTAIFLTLANAQTSADSILQVTKPKAQTTPTPTSIPIETPTITPTNTPTPKLSAAPIPWRTKQKEQSTPTPTSIPIETPTITPTNTPAPEPTVTPQPTITPTPLPTLATAPDLESLFQKYSDEYAVAKDLLKRIASCESGFNSQADTGLYAGMFQFASQTWINARNSMSLDPNPDLRKNPDESIRTAAFMIERGQQTAWKNCL